MAKGDCIAFRTQRLPCLVAGPEAVQLTAGAGMHYVPYFYNPHLHPNGRHLLTISQVHGTEQVFLLDLDRSTARQLTAAQGHDQYWAPYITVGVAGIRPQFVAWSQPDWQYVLFWEGNALRRVHTETLEEETLYLLPDTLVPQVLHCSATGLVAFGYLPAAVQQRFRQTRLTGAALRAAVQEGCGFLVYDLAQRQIVRDVPLPFWSNHVQASPDGRWVLFCQEGPWEHQRMHLYDSERGTWAALRPQDDGAAIGHEFWMSSTRVGYHGRFPNPQDRNERGFFGSIDVQSGERREHPSAHDTQYYGHYHTAPDGRYVVTDGEASADAISLAYLADETLRFQPVAHHHWERTGDQRYHPHPHWSADSEHITYTASARLPNGDVATQVILINLNGWRPQ